MDLGLEMCAKGWHHTVLGQALKFCAPGSVFFLTVYLAANDKRVGRQSASGHMQESVRHGPDLAAFYGGI
jgi:hypothetical protein